MFFTIYSQIYEKIVECQTFDWFFLVILEVWCFFKPEGRMGGNCRTKRRDLFLYLKKHLQEKDTIIG